MEEIIELIDAELQYYRKREGEATTRYERGEIAGCISILMHMRFVLKSKLLKEGKE